MLRDAQKTVGRYALLDDSQAVDRLFVSDRIAAARRLMVHRNNVMGSLIAALAAAYPVTAKAVGDAAFRLLAGQYVIANPPQEPRLSAYGAGLAAFFATRADLAFYPIVSDLARLDWAIHECFFAANRPALTAGELAVLPAEALPLLQLRLHPSVRLLTFARNVAERWRSLSEGRTVSLDDPTNEADAGEHILINRVGANPLQHAISSAEFTFLLAVQAGAPLEQAARAAEATAADFELAPVFAAHLSGGVYDGRASLEQVQANRSRAVVETCSRFKAQDAFSNRTRSENALGQEPT